MPDQASLMQIVTHLRKFGRLETLLAIAEIAARIDTDEHRMRMLSIPRRIGTYDIPQKIVLSTHSLTSLTKLTLWRGNRWSHRPPSFKDIVFLQNQIANLPTYSRDRKRSANEIFFQLSSQQFAFQHKDERLKLSRALILYKEIPAILNKGMGRQILDIESEFRRITGQNLEQFVWTGLALFGASLEGKPINLDGLSKFVKEVNGLWKGPEQERITEESIENFLEYVSLDLQEFDDRLGDFSKIGEESIPVDFQPLLEFPVVRIGTRNRPQFLVPIPKLLIDRITDGLFHDLANGISQHGSGNAFRETFGRLFERYVGLQLSLVFDELDLYPESNYGKQGKATPDWVVDHDIAMSIECRSSTFTLKSRQLADNSMISRDLARIGSETLSKLPDKMDDIIAGKTRIKLSHSDRLIGCLCTFESLEPLPMFGSMLLDELKNSHVSQTDSFHLIPIHYLEAMCATKNPATFMHALEQLRLRDDWGNLLNNEVEERWIEAMPSPIPKNPILENRAQEFFSALPFDRLNTLT